MTGYVPIGLETAYGIGYLVAMVAIAGVLTYAGLREAPASETGASGDAEPAD